MTMREEDIRELKAYIELLLQCQGHGINCKREISEALEHLHKAMGLKKDNRGIVIGHSFVATSEGITEIKNLDNK